MIVYTKDGYETLTVKNLDKYIKRCAALEKQADYHRRQNENLKRDLASRENQVKKMSKDWLKDGKKLVQLEKDNKVLRDFDAKNCERIAVLTKALLDSEKKETKMQNEIAGQAVSISNLHEKLAKETADANKWCKKASDLRLAMAREAKEFEKLEVQLQEAQQGWSNTLDKLGNKEEQVAKLAMKLDRASDEIDGLIFEHAACKVRAERLENIIVGMNNSLTELINETESDLINKREI